MNFDKFTKMIRLPQLSPEEQTFLKNRYQQNRQLLRDDLLNVCLFHSDKNPLCNIAERSLEMSLSLSKSLSRGRQEENKDENEMIK